jgi:hypothetical protein
VSALGELLQALNLVEERLDQARGQLVRSRTSLTEACAALRLLDPNHPETVVPPGMHRAHDQIERTLALVDHVTDAIHGFAARL